MFWKQKEVFSVIENFSYNPLFLTGSTNRFIKYFNENYVVHRCIHLISDAIACVKVNNKESLPIFELLRENRYSWHSFIKEICLNLFITGDCFILNKDYKLKTIPKNKINILLNNSKENVIGYQIDNSSDKRNIAAEHVFHIKFPDLNNEFLGLSPLYSLQLTIETHTALSNYLLGIFSNGGKPSGILTHETFLSRDKQTHIKDELHKMYKNMNNQGSIAILDGNYKWEPIGISPDKLQLIEHKLQLAKEICAVLGVPSILIGLSEATYSNYKESRKHFWLDTVFIYASFIIEQINLWQNTNLTFESSYEE